MEGLFSYPNPLRALAPKLSSSAGHSKHRGIQMALSPRTTILSCILPVGKSVLSYRSWRRRIFT
jgi:hypothetical protein